MVLIDCIGELLGAAREAEVNWQIQSAQRHTDAHAAELRAALRRMEQTLESSPLANIEADTEGMITRWNRAAEQIFGWSAGEMVGRNAISLLVPNLAREQVDDVVSILLDGHATNSRNINVTKDGREITCQWYNTVLYDADGGVVGWLSQIEDITEQLRAEQERVSLQEQVIAAQQAALRELSTPIIPIGEGVVAMPLIGNIDTMRAQLVIETLLEGVAETRARTAILDITGVQVVDTQVANALLRAAQAVRLLGAQVIITGIRPEVAQTLVGLGLDLSGIKTLSTLQSGIAYALSGAARR
ncbi:PAS domain S-box protein [Chloroflexales bacterium ZM16-3]|nr:PAS domain S-box protein [Chloroflexales bacterium ZM16-3]